MQYNFHIAKFKSGDIGGIRREVFREYKDPAKYRNCVDPDRTHLNYCRGLKDDGTGTEWQKEIRMAKDRSRECTGRNVRKDAVVLCSAVESVPRSWDYDTCRYYFEDKGRWFKKYLEETAGVDRNSLLSMAIHFDETTPHCTFAFIPLKDGRLQAKNILNRSFLRSVQKDGQDFTLEWIRTHAPYLEKPEPYTPDSERHHLSEVEYKEAQITKRERQLETEKQAFASLTHSPAFDSYKEAVRENQVLKEQLSLKERIIKNLTEERDRLLSYAGKLKEQLTDISIKAGSRLMVLFGYEPPRDIIINPYPSKDVSAGIRQMFSGLERTDPRRYRVLPDPGKSGTFRVAYSEKSGEYRTVESGFDSRKDAEAFRRSLYGATEAVQYNIEETHSIRRN